MQGSHNDGRCVEVPIVIVASSRYLKGAVSTTHSVCMPLGIIYR